MQPLALILYEKLLPGSQLSNRLQDLNYRVQSLSDPAQLVSCAEEAKPMVVLADFGVRDAEISAAVARLKDNPATSHLPVIGFNAQGVSPESDGAPPKGVTLLVSDTAILAHLRQFLDQALLVE